MLSFPNALGFRYLAVGSIQLPKYFTYQNGVQPQEDDVGVSATF